MCCSVATESIRRTSPAGGTNRIAEAWITRLPSPQSVPRSPATRSRMRLPGLLKIKRWLGTKVRGSTAGIWYHLYVILDVFSRKIVGWRAETQEHARLAEELVADAYAHYDGCKNLDTQRWSGRA